MLDKYCRNFDVGMIFFQTSGPVSNKDDGKLNQSAQVGVSYYLHGIMFMAASVASMVITLWLLRQWLIMALSGT